MTCKDCIHCDVCTQDILATDLHPYIDFSVRDDVEKSCDDFKDESKFIELPCSIGDIVYTIAYHNIFEAEVVCIRPFIFKDRIEYRGNVIITMEDSFYSDGRPLEQELFAVFGKDTFLTREEAEKKLEELK